MHSLRLKLLAWNAVVLAAVIGTFGTLLVVNERRTAWREVDDALRAQAAGLAAALRAEADGSYDLELSPQQVEDFRREGGGAPYYRIWSAAGEVVDTSHPDADVPPPAGPGVRERGPTREIALPGPGGSLVLVGRGAGEVRARLRALGWTVVAVGAGTMLLTLGGAWFLTGRALAPVARITRAAAAVSAANPSQRIDVARMESELRELSATINGAFDRLQQSAERQARFTADASHELRTPLAIVLSHAEHALKAERSPEEHRQALEAVRRAAKRMRAVVDGLLALARADAGEPLDRRPTDLAAVVTSACEALAPLAEERSVRLTVRAAPTRVLGDADRLAEVVANLVTNAVVYNREGGAVDVDLREADGQAVLDVADTGVGISEADRPHVFERFYRADKARSRAAGGNGLGLAITHWIVTAHGGTVSLESREGEGSTFTVRLPRDMTAARVPL